MHIMNIKPPFCPICGRRMKLIRFKEVKWSLDKTIKWYIFHSCELNSDQFERSFIFSGPLCSTKFDAIEKGFLKLIENIDKCIRKGISND